MSDKTKVNKLNVSAYRIPTDYPESDGTLEWDSTTLVLVELEGGGKRGLGYSYADESAAFLIDKTLRKIVVSTDIMSIDKTWHSMKKAVRNDGSCGIASMAISAIDSALWDLKAKILDLPLARLLGAVREEFRVYGSGGFTSYPIKKLQKQLEEWAKAGIKDVKMKIGREPEKDLHRIKAARKAIGNTIGLFVDANGAYSSRQALGKARQFKDVGVTWFEEPVPSDNLKGLHFIRGHVPSNINIAAGEYGYTPYDFQKMLDAEAVDVLQADATRCGGITGFMQIAGLCRASQLPLSSHGAPTLHLHAALSAPSFYTAEYFHDHVRIENIFFDGISLPLEGTLRADMERPGLGIEVKKKNVVSYQIYP